ncbi:MAG: chorismate-binding protein [bacterium]|nr:chorismate-binding protein [bacterium]
MCRAFRYPTVHQMISTVQGKMRDDATLLEVFRATFPPGSVTGAPKIRALELIKELEHTPRESIAAQLRCSIPTGISSAMWRSARLRLTGAWRRWESDRVSYRIVNRKRSGMRCCSRRNLSSGEHRHLDCTRLSAGSREQAIEICTVICAG